MDLLVRGRSPTEMFLKITENHLKTVISGLSASDGFKKPDTASGIAFQVSKKIRRFHQKLNLCQFSVAQVKTANIAI